MRKWVKDGLIGWGAVAAFTMVVSIATDAPYTFFSTLIYSLLISIPFGAPGGILLGRKHEGWAWPFAGGILSAFVFGLVIIFFQNILNTST